MLTKILIPKETSLYQKVNEHTASFIKQILMPKRVGGGGGEQTDLNYTFGA